MHNFHANWYSRLGVADQQTEGRTDFLVNHEVITNSVVVVVVVVAFNPQGHSGKKLGASH